MVFRARGLTAIVPESYTVVRNRSALWIVIKKSRVFGNIIIYINHCSSLRVRVWHTIIITIIKHGCFLVGSYIIWCHFNCCESSQREIRHRHCADRELPASRSRAGGGRVGWHGSVGECFFTIFSQHRIDRRRLRRPHQFWHSSPSDHWAIW